MSHQEEQGDYAYDILAYASEIVSAHVSHNKVEISELPELISQVYQTLTALSQGSFSHAQRPEPAVPVNKSVKPGYIICLEDGKKLKMLKRHLKTAYNMTPEEYKDRWGLGIDYPMVAPDYAKQRSALAKSIGLGKRSR